MTKKRIAGWALCIGGGLFIAAALIPEKPESRTSAPSSAGSPTEGTPSVVRTETDAKALLEQLRRPGAGLREAFAFVDAGEATIPVLVEATEDEQAQVRGLACFALGELKTPSEAVIEALRSRLADHDHETRYAAARALGSLRRVPDDIVQQLENVRRTDPSPTARGGAEEALLAITGSAPTPLRTIDELLDSLRSANPHEREEALNGIGRFALAEPEVAGQERVLRGLADRLLNDDYFQARSSAAQAMLRAGKTPTFILDALLRAVDDRDLQVRAMAIGTLASFGAKSAPALPRLKEIAADEKYPELASIASTAIRKISAK